MSSLQAYPSVMFPTSSQTRSALQSLLINLSQGAGLSPRRFNTDSTGVEL